MIGAFDQELAEIAIAGLCNAELGIAVPGLASAWSQAKIAANISASLETLLSPRVSTKVSSVRCPTP